MTPVRTIRPFIVLAVVLALGAIGCTPSPKPTPTVTAPTVEATSSPEVPAASEDTPTVASLAGADLSQMQEGLVFDYLRAGGVKALETRFGKATKSYQTAADESSTGYTELPDGRAMLVQCGLAADGTALVMAHSVEAKQGQTETAADKAFIKDIVDGKTTMDAANAYLKQAGGTLQTATMDPKGLNVPAHVWALKDGSGFIVVDLTKLTVAQRTELGMEDEGPYQALYWDATHWKAY
jgi:hypothetical protein